MTRVCPAGHPSDAGHRICPLCGRKYVAEELVVPPPTTQDALAIYRENLRIAKALSREGHVIPTAREEVENTAALPGTINLRTKVLTMSTAATFVGAFAMGEALMASIRVF